MIFPIEPHPHHHHNFIFVPAPRPQQNFTVPLSVTKHHVKVAINDLAATTKVDQTFYNKENRTIEGLYMFPLPESASISGFEMDIDGKMTKGELLDAEKAKKTYEDIVRQMKDPGLLEYMGSGLFKTRIYPINARSEKRVKLNYQEALKINGNLVRYVYPLRIDRFSQDEMKDVSIEVKIKSKTSITSVYSPTHKISIHRNGPHDVTVGFEADRLNPEKDFILYYAVSKKELSVSFMANRPDPSEDGTFMMMIAPRMKAQDEKAPKINVALVMDTSGSMAGKKITQAKKALKFCINSLKDGSNFYLANFSTEADEYKNKLVPINADTREGALDYITNLDAMGGTNISEALEKSINVLKKAENKNPGFIVFVTDGKPTAGITETDEILSEVKKQNTSKFRIFTFGIGDNLNAKLIDSIAHDNGATSDYVAENEDLEIKISSLFSKLTHPVMTDVSLVFNNVKVNQIYPRKPGDIFKDSNIIVLGRYKKEGEALVSLTGLLKDKHVKLDYEVSFPRREKDNAFVSKIWATRKIGFLLDQIRKNGDDDELRNELIKLAKKYGILTPYTSFLVMEDKEKNGIDLQPVPMRKRIHMDEYVRAKKRYSIQKLSSDFEGSDAVGASREMNSMRMANTPTPSYVPVRSYESKAIPQIISKTVSSKTFYFIDNKWVDSEMRDKEAKIKINAFSTEYFKLIKDFPEIGKYLSLGKNIVVKFNNTSYEITQ